MAATSTLSGTSYVYSRRVVSHVRTYNWPPLQLNFWIFVMLLASSSIMGVFGYFITIQTQLLLPVPWYFPYFITVGGLTILFIAGLFWLIYNRRLLPAIVMIGAFMLFVLWLVGLIIVSIQLWGPNGSVQSNCNLVVFDINPTGSSERTMAWLMQRSQSWHLVFAMALTGIIFLFWIMIMAYQVFADS
ncbi:hypothetical protein S40285_04693 [Stachybotrys chlorohalonatus IBT 40285]|uniref:MARVEL domain-containing protein n=2 Tax=Stachybotrys TaxID=74721 RepID=A0A084R303_STAC4|nr:hypothetical protein S7711_03130 [Stachybotrys chartarum IBT 7711]KFA55375.1 hypothetical protein S40293_05716 [Stachybotrys chartarum IBT 40293]KFA70588.1 hypothetical protein S40285_04693 [Stachybotrys chlorohalonata IBT 40285]